MCIRDSSYAWRQLNSPEPPPKSEFLAAHWDRTAPVTPLRQSRRFSERRRSAHSLSLLLVVQKPFLEKAIADDPTPFMAMDQLCALYYITSLPRGGVAYPEFLLHIRSV